MIRENLRWMASMLLAANLALVAPGAALAAGDKDNKKGGGGNDVGGAATETPIKHVVVIFQENVSFDHYFGSYPDAENLSEETKFKAKKDTPTVNGFTAGLMNHNLNKDAAGTFYSPVRLAPSQNYTCDMNHDYTPEQQAFDSGLMDKFPEFAATPCNSTTWPDVSNLGAGIVMGYYDGNTVTGLWNYAQNFVLNDNSFDTNFGPSTPGAINVVSGMTGNADPNANVNTTGDVVDLAVIGDPDPFYDDCSGSEKVGMSASNLEHWQFAERQGHFLGLVPGRIHANHSGGTELGWYDEVASTSAKPPPTASTAPRKRPTARTTTRSNITSRPPTRTTWPQPI